MELNLSIPGLKALYNSELERQFSMRELRDRQQSTSKRRYILTESINQSSEVCRTVDMLISQIRKDQ